MINPSNETPPLSISIWGKNNSGSPNKFTFPVRSRIEEEFAKAALSSSTQSQTVKYIEISLHLSERTSPNPPYIGKVSRINNSVGVGIELTWLVDKNIDESRVQMMLGKPLLGLLLGVFETFDIPYGPFLKSLSTNPGWSEIIDSLPSSEPEDYANFASLTLVSMDEEACWELIEKSKQFSSSNKQQEELLIAELSKLDAEDVREFASFFHCKMVELYRWDLWAIGYIINGGCSDDGFTEFRAWLICQGREFYHQAIIRPEFIGEQVPAEAIETCDTLYGFDLAAGPVYEEKTGYEMNNLYPREPRDPVGDRWDEDELPSIYPSLCRKFQLPYCVQFCKPAATEQQD